VCPELIPPSAVERTEELSKLISNAVAKCDPQVSALLDFGNANPPESDKSGGRFRNVPIAVIASGDNGNILTFLRVENEMIDVAQGDGQSTRIPRIGTSETAQWAAGTAPIRQIRFADSIDEPAGLMAVRLQLSTVIFRPLFRRDRIPAKALGGSEHTSIVPPHNSHLDPNPVVEIATSKTGGSAHVDVTFNPWYQRQFAIIDENGRWSIWNISHRSKRVGSESASCVHSGSVPPAGYQKRTEIDNQLQFDGWGRVEWVRDVGTFVACSRRNMILYIFEGDVFSSMIVELVLKSSEWILDLKRSSVQMSQLFILTTLRIFCLNIDPQPNGRNPRSCIAPQLSCQHFRDPEDITLRLTSLCIGEGNIDSTSSYEIC
jgi:RNA polymerase I-specific transcription initiation factor RRN6